MSIAGPFLEDKRTKHASFKEIYKYSLVVGRSKAANPEVSRSEWGVGGGIVPNVGDLGGLNKSRRERKREPWMLPFAYMHVQARPRCSECNKTYKSYMGGRRRRRDRIRGGIGRRDKHGEKQRPRIRLESE